VSIYTAHSHKFVLSSLLMVVAWSTFRKKTEFSADAWKCWDSELSHEDCLGLAANSRSMGPQAQNTDDHNCPVDNAERSSSADRRTADIDYRRRRLFVCNSTVEQCSMNLKTSTHQHGELEYCTRSVKSNQLSSSVCHVKW